MNTIEKISETPVFFSSSPGTVPFISLSHLECNTISSRVSRVGRTLMFCLPSRFETRSRHPCLPLAGSLIAWGVADGEHQRRAEPQPPRFEGPGGPNPYTRSGDFGYITYITYITLHYIFLGTIHIYVWVILGTFHISHWHQSKAHCRFWCLPLGMTLPESYLAVMEKRWMFRWDSVALSTWWFGDVFSSFMYSSTNTPKWWPFRASVCPVNSRHAVWQSFPTCGFLKTRHPAFSDFQFLNCQSLSHKADAFHNIFMFFWSRLSGSIFFLHDYWPLTDKSPAPYFKTLLFFGLHSITEDFGNQGTAGLPLINRHQAMTGN